MVQTLTIQRICQRPEYMVLPHRVGKIFRSPFPCEYEIAHKLTSESPKQTIAIIIATGIGQCNQRGTRDTASMCQGARCSRGGPRQPFPGTRRPPLPLLPSGPDGVHGWPSRGDQRGPAAIIAPLGGWHNAGAPPARNLMWVRRSEIAILSDSLYGLPGPTAEITINRRRLCPECPRSRLSIHSME